MILPISLTAAGIAALVNMWLSIRVGQVRGSEKVSIGDGGNEKVIRRMRAHSNYTEFTPFVLILIALVELAHGAGPPPMWLWVVVAVYFIARIAHALGMDGAEKGRVVGIIGTLIVMVGLGVYAIAIPHVSSGSPEVATPADVQSAEEVPAG